MRESTMGVNVNSIYHKSVCKRLDCSLLFRGTYLLCTVLANKRGARVPQSHVI